MSAPRLGTPMTYDRGPAVEEHVILVDVNDAPIGSEAKLRAHLTGQRHRAVSVFLFGGDGRVLLQQRAIDKYHSPGLWSNTCCGHPRPGESTIDAALRRLEDEMGISCELGMAFSFEYRATLDGGLIEHEIDHVFTGTFDGTPAPNPREVSDWRWASLEGLTSDCAAHPERYSAWLPLALARLADDGYRQPRASP